MLKALNAGEIVEAARRYDVDPAGLRAVIAVETGGRGGFLADGRCRILFERHCLWKRLEAEDRRIDPSRLGAERPDLCGQRWDPKRHPYGTESRQWDRLAAVLSWAQRHDPAHWESYKKAAYEACSWGLFQLMGSHYHELGYANVYDFKHAQEEGEGRQLEDALLWMQRAGLLPALRARRWTEFARRYNGPGQVQRYAAGLSEAYDRARV